MKGPQTSPGVLSLLGRDPHLPGDADPGGLWLEPNLPWQREPGVCAVAGLGSPVFFPHFLLEEQELEFHWPCRPLHVLSP